MKPLPRPPLRPLRIYTTDPTRRSQAAQTTTIRVENEVLLPGPIGARLEVVDYDGYADIFLDRVDLDDKTVLMQNGLAPSESDPRFHQQMVYAVASRTLANFDRALGRRIDMRKGSHKTRLRLFPHAFRGDNAFYDREAHAVFFGYFEADERDPGPNIPGQTIFTCLSHDIIVHEMTHAIVDRLRRYFLEPTNRDVLAFHEGFADLVALFQHFSYRDLLASEIKRVRGDLKKGTVLVDLAEQFGLAKGKGKALRTALDNTDPKLYETENEPHRRGSILVAAVFDGFITTYQSRIADLILIATGGSGELPRGNLQQDLINRIAGEAATIAQRQLDMCIRAFDYLPPVDITFGDYLRALVTADFELNPEDEWGQRAALIEAFRQRGIIPSGITSLAEESLRWQPPEEAIDPPQDQLSELLLKLLWSEAEHFSKKSLDQTVKDPERFYARKKMYDFSAQATEEDPAPLSDYIKMTTALVNYAKANHEAFRLTGNATPYISDFDAVFRTAPNGGLLVELVVQFVETDKATEDDPEWGGVPLRGGSTVILGIDGTVRYVITKPLPGTHLKKPTSQTKADARKTAQVEFVRALDAADPQLSYLGREAYANRMKARMSLRALHEGHSHV
jgi:hypothetical protein